MNIEGEITDNPDQIAEISQRIRTDFVEFAQTILRDDTGNRITLAPIHIAWIAHAQYSWARGKGCVINAMMAHGKTQIVGVGMPLHALSQDPNIRIKIISATDDLAADRVTGIRSIIDNSPEFRAYCPHVRPSRKDREAVSAKKMWARKKFFLQRSGQSLDASVEGYGILSSGVGGRADLEVLDDPVDEKNSQSEVTRKRVLNQFEKIWMTRLSPRSRWIMISTPYHHDDLNAHVRRNPDVCVLEQAISEDFGSVDFKVYNTDTDHPLYALST